MNFDKDLLCKSCSYRVPLRSCHLKSQVKVYQSITFRKEAGVKGAPTNLQVSLIIIHQGLETAEVAVSSQ